MYFLKKYREKNLLINIVFWRIIKTLNIANKNNLSNIISLDNPHEDYSNKIIKYIVINLILVQEINYNKKYIMNIKIIVHNCYIK